jgi:hypothetical protein
VGALLLVPALLPLTPGSRALAALAPPVGCVIGVRLVVRVAFGAVGALGGQAGLLLECPSPHARPAQAAAGVGQIGVGLVVGVALRAMRLAGLVMVWARVRDGRGVAADHGPA